MNLRDYQTEAVVTLWNGLFKTDPQLCVMATGCLTGDSVISFNRGGKGFKKRLDEAFLSFNKKKNPWDKRIKTYVRSYNGKSIQLHEIEDIVYSGVKEVFLLKLNNNRTIKATSNHKIMTKRGWVKLSDLSKSDEVMCDSDKASKRVFSYKKHYDSFWSVKYHPYARLLMTKNQSNGKRYPSYRVESHRIIYEAKLNKIDVTEFRKILNFDPIRSKKFKFINPKIYDIHHIDMNHKNNSPKNLIHLKKRRHQLIHSKLSKFNFNQGIPIYSKVESITTLGKDLVFDIVCKDPYRNFVANGIVVHNSGKTMTAIALIQKCIQVSSIKVLFLVQRINLVTQTENAMKQFIDPSKVGAYCASIKRREIAQVTVSTIQSISKAEIEKFDVLIVDEVHNMNQEEGRYSDFLEKLRSDNPKIKIIGLTATPYNSGGLIFGEDKLFKKIHFKKGLAELIRYGYLVQPVMKHGLSSFNTDQLHIRGGDYSLQELEEMTTDARKVHDQVKDALPRLHERKAIAWACTFIKHAELVKRQLELHGESVSIVHSNMEDLEREVSLEQFVTGMNRHLVFVSALSEGWDHPPTDAIVLMRPTRSATLYVQICGRGLRTFQNKQNCLILDYGRVVASLGPLDNPQVNEPGKKSRLNSPPMKFCPACLSYIPKTLRECPDCSLEFESEEFTKNLTNLPAEEVELINEQHGYIRTYGVSECSLSIHVSKNGNRCLKITYWPTDRLMDPREMLAEYFVWDQTFSRARGMTRLRQLGCAIPAELEQACSQVPQKNPIEVKYVKEKKYRKVVELIFGERNRDGNSGLAQPTA